MSKNIVLRIRKIYYDQIVAGTKIVELRAYTPFWRIRLTNQPYPEIATFICGRRIHRRHILKVTEGHPDAILGRLRSAQGMKDVPGTICYAIWLGEAIIQ